MSNITENENPHTIIGSVLLNVELGSQSKLSILSVHFLVLESDLQYAILGGLELENTQTLLRLACKSMCSFLHNGEESQWTSLRTYQSYDLENEFPDSMSCRHALLSEKIRKSIYAIIQKYLSDMFLKVSTLSKIWWIWLVSAKWHQTASSRPHPVWCHTTASSRLHPVDIFPPRQPIFEPADPTTLHPSLSRLRIKLSETFNNYNFL